MEKSLEQSYVGATAGLGAASSSLYSGTEDSISF